MIAVMNKKTLPIFFALMSMFGLAACDDDKAPTVPVEIPFDMGKVEQTWSQVFTIKEKEPLTYTVDLTFSYERKKNKEDNIEESQKLYKLLGLSYDAQNQPIYGGVPLTMQITVTRVRDQAVMLKQTTKNPKSFPGAGGRYARIGEIKLEPGVYKVDLRYLEGAPQLAKIPTTVFIARHGAK
jgi:Domain of unknown function (DUF5625)